MKRESMKQNVIRYSMIVLLIGLVALAAGRTYAQERGQWIEVLSYSWGFTQGETARISLTLRRLANPQQPTVNARIQLLDTEGRVISQSNEIRVEPGQIRFWDAPRNLIPAAGEPGTGRLQLRTRMLVTTSSIDLAREALMPTIEIIDGATGRTLHKNDGTFKIFVCDINTCWPE